MTIQCQHCGDIFEAYKCVLCGGSPRACKECHEELVHEKTPEIANRITGVGYDHLAPRQRAKNKWGG